jgi:hypothetical protein
MSEEGRENLIYVSINGCQYGLIRGNNSKNADTLLSVWERTSRVSGHEPASVKSLGCGKSSYQYDSNLEEKLNASTQKAEVREHKNITRMIPGEPFRNSASGKDVRSGKISFKRHRK